MSPIRHLTSDELVEHVKREETGDAILRDPAVVKAIADSRSRLVAGCRGDPMSVSGRVAVYQPGMNLLDRLAYAETSGFIDYSDCPGWDTWIGLLYGEPDNAAFPGIMDSLAFWVPAGYEWMMAAANAVCSCSTLCWIEEFSGDVGPDVRRVLLGGGE